MARTMPGLEYANLAVRGRKLGTIATEQVSAALDLNPDLISIGAGANDIIRLSTDVASLNRLAHATIGRLTDSGARVAVFTGFDPRLRIPGTRAQGHRAEIYNEAIRRAAEHFDATVIELWDLPRLYEDMMWAPDRLHLSTAGHQLIAVTFLDALRIPHSLEDPAPIPEVGPPTARETARWIARDVLPWAYRGFTGKSSGDGRQAKVPQPILASSLPN
jgi:lysophospholipase L1-like esterase